MGRGDERARAALEQRVSRAILPRFHAGFSLGTVAGATVGVMVVRHVPVDVHLLGTALLVASSVPLAASRFLSDDADLPPTAGALTGPPVTIWWERRTLTIGVVAAAFAMAEGAGNNWISVSVTARHGATATTGGLAYTAFLGSVTVGRWCGPPMLDRWGRVAVLRSAVGTAVAGLFLFVLGPVQAAVLAGIVLWGLGASLGFPVSLSAGADQPAHAASRVGVIATVGYCGFLGGPPLIGLLGDQVGVTSALLVVAAPLVIAARFARATRPLAIHLATATPPESVRRRPHRPRSPSRRQPC